MKRWQTTDEGQFHVILKTLISDITAGKHDA